MSGLRLFFVSACLAGAFAAAGCGAGRETVPQRWRPVKIGEKDFYAVMNPCMPCMDDMRELDDTAAFRSLFLRLGGWGEQIGLNPLNFRNPNLYNTPEQRFKRLPYTVWDTMGPDHPHSRKRAHVKFWGKRVPFTLSSLEGWVPWFMQDEYDCDRGHFRKWLEEYPNFQGFTILNEGVFAITREFDMRSGAYENITNKVIRAQCERDFPPCTNYGGRVRWWPKTMARERALFFGTDRFERCIVNDGKNAHQSFKYGVGLVTYECDQQATGAVWAQMMWHCRGASRQFRKPFIWYMAHLFRGYDRAGNPVTGEWRSPMKRFPQFKPKFGASRTLGRCNYFYGYFAGANGLEVEQDGLCFNEYHSDGTTVPSEYFNDYNAAFEMAERQPRGVVWTPVVALTSLYEGYSPLGYNYASGRTCFSGNAFFYTLQGPAAGDVPVIWGCDRKKGENGCLYNSEFGEICDVLCPDAGQPPEEFSDALAPYRMAFLFGGFDDKADYDLASVLSWVRRGGVLVCCEDALQDGLVTSTMTGVTFGGAAVPSGKSLVLARGGVVDTLDDAYSLYPGSATTAKPYLNDDKGTAVVWENAVGRGKVLTIAARQALPDKLLNLRHGDGNWFFKLQKEVSDGKTVFPIYRHLLRRAQSEYLPVAVKGDVQWGVNRLDDGSWLVWMINNKGYRHFQGEPDEYDESATAEVTVTLRATGEKRTVRVGPGQCEQVKFGTGGL